MIPSWLMAPPAGLSEAERRVLEAFFVAEDVKATATLLCLAPKTVQNELLLARQTMGESKSWMASIRYVFYVKRQGIDFVEAQLVPRIDRQVRRLIDDYLEHTEVQSSNEQGSPGAEVSTVALSAPDPSTTKIERTEFTYRELVPVEQFEFQLKGLMDVVAKTYERPARRRKARLTMSLVVAGLCVIASWGFLSRRESLMSLGDVRAGLERVRASVGTASYETDCADLADKLCERYQRELWGPDEPSVISAFQKYEAEVEVGVKWAAAYDKELALRILGNGHRAFCRASILSGEWFPMLQEVVQARQSDQTISMVRALCGVVFGCLNNANKAEVNLTVEDAKGYQEKAAARLAKLALVIEDRADRANALRHVAMTHNAGIRDTAFRVALCQQALNIYYSLGENDTAKRGSAQCLLSIAERGNATPLDHISGALKAYPAIKGIGNPYMKWDCIKLAADNVGLALKENMRPQLMGDARAMFWEYAETCDPIPRLFILHRCLEIDGKVFPSKVPADIQELLIEYKNYELGTETREQLVGFVYARLQTMNAKLKPALQVTMSQELKQSMAFLKGKGLSDAEAVSLIRGYEPLHIDPAKSAH